MIYKTVFYDILNKITAGAYKHGERLPTAQELMAEYGVSRTTIVKAMNRLREMQLVVTNKRGGTFVQYLQEQKKYRVPVILPYANNNNSWDRSLQYNPRVYSGILSFALNNHMSCPYYNYSGNIVVKRKILEKLIREEPDGIIIYPKSYLQLSDLYSELELLKIPICFIDRKYVNSSAPVVGTDNFSAMKQLVGLLIDNGHRYIGFFGMENVPGNATTISDRLSGYYAAHIERGLKVEPHLIFTNAFSPHWDDMLCDSFFYRKDKNATAVACVSDGYFYQLYALLQRNNIQIPLNVSVTGFDNVIDHDNYPFRLTTYEQDFHKIGYTAAQTMLRMLQHQPVKDTFLPGKLLQGTSVASLNATRPIKNELIPQLP